MKLSIIDFMNSINCYKNFVKDLKSPILSLFLVFLSTFGLIFAENNSRVGTSIGSQSEFHVGLNSSFNPGIRRATFNQEFDHYNHSNPGANWYALRVDSETAQSWQSQPHFIELSYLFQSGPWTLQAKGGLGRDIEAWYRDELGSNIPQGINELNINSTPQAFAQYQDDYFKFKIGQYQPIFGPTPKRSVTINSELIHKGLESRLQLGDASMTWFWSSLDPTLSTDEKKLQSQSLVSNARGATYTDELKSLYMHRLDYNLGKLELGIMESIIIGGKQASFWEIQPITVYHNNYPDGYANTLLSIDFKWTQNYNTLFGEIGMDDLTGGNAESSENSSNIIAWRLGYQYERPYLGGKLKTQIEVVSVDPIYGNRDLPLLPFTQRQVLRSNYRDMEDLEQKFVDTYVVDQPIGYLRGPDVMDYWWELSWENATWGFGYELGYLQKGNYDFSKKYNQATNNPKGPVSPIFKELRQTMDGFYILPWRHWSQSKIQAGFILEQDLSQDENNFSGFFQLTWGVI